jgi:hypothetical protein
MADNQTQQQPSLLQRALQERTQNGATDHAPPSDSAPTDLLGRAKSEREETINRVMPPALSLTPRGEPKDMTWTETGKQAVKNLPSSAYRAAESVVHPFLHPIETYESVKELGKGAVSKGKGYLGYEQDPQQKAKDEAAINAVRDFYASRYGSMAGFKHALAEDPASVLMDLSVPLTLGESAVAKIPGTLGEIAKIGAISKATNPLSAIPFATRMASKAIDVTPGLGAAKKVVTDWAALAPEKMAGIAPGSIKTAIEAGFENNKPFVEQMRGTAPASNIIDRADDVFDKIASRQKSDYLNSMAGVRANQAPVSYGDINTTLAKSRSSIQPSGLPGQMPEAERALNEIQHWIETYQNNGLNSLGDLDNLKKTIANIAENYRGNSQAYRVANELKDSVRSTIANKSPEYLEIMDRYGDAQEQLKNIKYATGDAKKTETQRLAKILSSSKDKTKKSILEEMAKEDPDLAKAIAGLSMQDWKYHSMLSALGGGSLGYLGIGHPVGGFLGTIGGAAASSPRVLGELGYGAGKTQKFLETPKLGAVPVGELGHYEQLKEREQAMKDRYGRKFGGRVGNAMMKADALIRKADQAKRNLNKTTEPMLELPDEHVTKALAVAKSHI